MLNDSQWAISQIISGTHCTGHDDAMLRAVATSMYFKGICITFDDEHWYVNVQGKDGEWLKVYTTGSRYFALIHALGLFAGEYDTQHLATA